MRDDIVNIQGPHSDSKSGRKNISVYFLDGRRVVKSYPKFLVEFLLDRELDRKLETVDHIDGNFHNNAWSNLRILPMLQHLKEDARHCDLVVVSCVGCGAEFLRPPRDLQAQARRGVAGPFCSKACAGKYGADFQNGKVEKVQVLYQDQRVYRKYKKTADDHLAKVAEATEWNEESILAWVHKLQDRVHEARPKKEFLTQTGTKRVRRGIRTCVQCGWEYQPRRMNQKYCSIVCMRMASRKVPRPSKDELERLVWQQPKLSLAKQLGVCDKAIEKWCKQLVIKMPGRGYWAKVRAGKISTPA